MASPFSIIKVSDGVLFKYPVFQRWSGALLGNQVYSSGIGPISINNNSPIGLDDPILSVPNIGTFNYYEIKIQAAFFLQIINGAILYPLSVNNIECGYQPGALTGIYTNGQQSQYAFCGNAGKLETSEALSTVDFTKLSLVWALWPSYNITAFPIGALSTPNYLGGAFNVSIKAYG